jgi:hypothetical protein
MSAADLVGRLQKVRRLGPQTWKARCPAHRDRQPSLSVRELDDGRVLVHCFGGCDVNEVLGALGLELDALYPPREAASTTRGSPPERRPYSAAELLHFVDKESLVVLVAAVDCLRRGSLRQADLERVMQARERIAQVMWCLPT